MTPYFCQSHATTLMKNCWLPPIVLGIQIYILQAFVQDPMFVPVVYGMSLCIFCHLSFALSVAVAYFQFPMWKKLLSLVQSPLSSKATLHPLLLLLLLLLLSRSVVSDSVRPHRRQPTRLPHPWVSPGKNTGVGCHFLLQYTHYHLSNLYPTKVPKRYFWNPI